MGSIAAYNQPLVPFQPVGPKPFAAPLPSAAPLSDYQQVGQTVQTLRDQVIINKALTLLGQIRHLPQDEAYIRQMGIFPGFANGQDAFRLIQNKGIRVEFGDMGESPAHAQWIAEENLIMINQRYRGDETPATLNAISEAMYHEAGHAAGNGDSESSVQEELDCLALNTLAHRYHQATVPGYAHTASTSPLMADGVALYAKLFFDPDPNKQALVNRVVNKYGDLPLDSPGHPTVFGLNALMPIASRVKAQFNARSAAQSAEPLKGPVPPPLLATPMPNPGLSSQGLNQGLSTASDPMATPASATRLSYQA